MKRTLGYQASDLIFQSPEFEAFNEFTSDLSATKIFEYVKEIKDNCLEKEYSSAWIAALEGAKTGLDSWEETFESGSLEEFRDILDEHIVSALYDFFFSCEKLNND